MEFMNSHTRESLSLDYVFKRLLPLTPYGLQEKSSSRPFKPGEEELLEEEYDRIEILMEALDDYRDEFKEIEHILRGVKEIRGSLKRLQEGMVLDEVEFFEIKNFILCVRDLSSIQKDMGELPEELRLMRLEEVEGILDPEGHGNRTFYVYDSYSEELKCIRERKKEIQLRFDGERKRVFGEVEKLLDLRPKLNGEITVFKRDSERLEHARTCPYLSEGVSTALSITFRVRMPGEIEGLQDELEDLKLQEEREEYGVRRNLSSELRGMLSKIYEEVKRLGRLDFLIAKARFALSIGGIRPVLQQDTMVSVKEGRHLRLEELLHSKGKSFVPVSFAVRRGVTVITGANMGGKTVSMKVCGMLVAMAQMGLFVPAEELKTCLFDYIYFSIGDMQSLDTGLSTFGSEIMGMIDILDKSYSRGLILIDELARGTNPLEGHAISRAIVRFLKNSEAVTLFTTHFDGITHEKGIEHLQVRGLKGVNIDTLMVKLKGEKRGMEAILEYMDYTLERVEGDYRVPEDAINIARLMGLEDRILEWAEEILEEGREDSNGKA